MMKTIDTPMWDPQTQGLVEQYGINVQVYEEWQLIHGGDLKKN